MGKVLGSIKHLTTDTIVFQGGKISQTVPLNTEREREKRHSYFTLLHDR